MYITYGRMFAPIKYLKIFPKSLLLFVFVFFFVEEISISLPPPPFNPLGLPPNYFRSPIKIESNGRNKAILTRSSSRIISAMPGLISKSSVVDKVLKLIGSTGD